MRCWTRPGPRRACCEAGPWTIRDGPGRRQARVGGNGANGAGPRPTLPQAEEAMRALGQPPLFMIRAGEDRAGRGAGAAGLSGRGSDSVLRRTGRRFRACPRPDGGLPALAAAGNCPHDLGRGGYRPGPAGRDGRALQARMSRSWRGCGTGPRARPSSRSTAIRRCCTRWRCPKHIGGRGRRGTLLRCGRVLGRRRRVRRGWRWL